MKLSSMDDTNFTSVGMLGVLLGASYGFASSCGHRGHPKQVTRLPVEPRGERENDIESSEKKVNGFLLQSKRVVVSFRNEQVSEL